MVPETPSGLPVLSNPWATAGNSSRAAAYGISFDDAGETNTVGSFLDVKAATTSTNEGVTAGNIPLLTPGAILSSEQEDEGNEAARAYSLFAALEDMDEL